MNLLFFIFILAVLGLFLLFRRLEFRRVTYVDREGHLRTRTLVSRRRGFGLLSLANYAPPGTHRNSLTRFSDVNLPSRNLLMKKGTVDGRMNICGAHDYPIGFCPDDTTGQSFLSGASTYSTYPLTLLLLGAAADETRLGTASGAVVAHTPAFAADNGALQATPVASGTYYQIGEFITSGADGDDVEVITCLPRKLIVT